MSLSDIHFTMRNIKVDMKLICRMKTEGCLLDHNRLLDGRARVSLYTFVTSPAKEGRFNILFETFCSRIPRIDYFCAIRKHTHICKVIRVHSKFVFA